MPTGGGIHAAGTRRAGLASSFLEAAPLASPAVGRTVPSLASHPTVVHTVLPTTEDAVDASEGEHGKGPYERASLDDGPTPDQGVVAGLVQQAADRHLHVGEEPQEQDPGDDLSKEDRLRILPAAG